MKKIAILIFLLFFFGVCSVYSQEARKKAPVNKTEQAAQEMKTANQTPLIGSAGQVQATDDATGPVMVRNSPGPAQETAASDPEPASRMGGAATVPSTKTTARSSQVTAANSHLNGAEPD
jgi:hypothetical protein